MEGRYPEIAANAALVLLGVALSLLDRQIAAQARAFQTEGGFTGSPSFSGTLVENAALPRLDSPSLADNHPIVHYQVVGRPPHGGLRPRRAAWASSP